MLNHIVIMGRLTRDPELRYTQSQTPVASFTVAVDRDFGGRDGGEKQTDFIDCVAWRQTAEFVNKYFTKGSMAAVSGRLQIRDWTDRDGGKRRSAEIVVENIYFGESRRRDGGNGSNNFDDRPSDKPYGGSYENTPASGNAGKTNGFEDVYSEDDDDLPF